MSYWQYHLKAQGHDDLAALITIIDEPDFLPRGHLLARRDHLRAIRHPVLWACGNPLDLQDTTASAEQVWGPGGFFLLHWDAAHEPTAHTAPWPCFLIEQQRLSHQTAPGARQHRISFLSGRVRPHRLALWLQIRPLITEQDVVVINGFGLDLCGIQHPALADVPWSSHARFLDQAQHQQVCHNTTATDHAAFRACVNITAESLGARPGIFVTEKTWKALAAGCMLWHHGCEGMARYLQALGFQDWFDQNSADARDLFRRDDIWDFYQANQHRVAQEIELFWSPALRQRVTQPALARLRSWVER